MKRILLLTSAACLVLAGPVAAQNNSGGMSSHERSTQSQTQNQNDKSKMQASNSQEQSRAIEPANLGEEEIRQIQMNLNKAGFSSGSVDGIWGEDTREALRNFQQQKKLPGDGQLNQQTLAELGVNSGRHDNRSSQSGDQTEHQTTGSAAGRTNAASDANKSNMNSQPGSQIQDNSGQGTQR